MMLHVQYENHSYDYVDTDTLDRLLAGKGIRQFYRPSEQRWIHVDHGPIRGLGGDYSGPNRRQQHKAA